MVYKYREYEPGDKKDEGGKPVSLEGVYQVPSGNELKLANELADFISEIASKGERVMMVGGKTSAGLLYVNGDSDVGRGIQGVEMRRIESKEALKINISGSDIELVDAKPVAITVPAGATVKAVNDFLKAEYGASFRVDYDITTNGTSHLGANLLTGGLGDNREALDVLEVTLITDDGIPKSIRTRAEVGALRASQGYAGTITNLKLRVVEDFPNEEVWVVPLSSDGISVYGANYAELLADFWEYMHGRATNGMRIVGAEVLHRSGTETIKRMVSEETNNVRKGANKFDDTTLDGKEGAVLLRIRHGFDDVLEHNPDNPFVTKMMELYDAGVIGAPSPLSDAADIQAITDLREAVPEKAREEAGKKGVFSQSMDVDTVIRVPHGVNPDSVRASVRAAYMALIRPFLDAEEYAREKGIRVINNGHLLAVSREIRRGRNIDSYFDGGANPHTRFTGTIDQEWVIKGIHSQVGSDLRTLHGRSFGAGVNLSVKEGEKHYPTDAGALAHFAQTHPRLAAARAHAIVGAGKTFNFRAPDQIAKTVLNLAFPNAAK